ncbi:MAG TPA: oligosaccharide flippase family protein [Chitinophagaceae bacterium]|nr:oligosaccharide flippase family protein [Chitinophagaceae bacterium]
MFLVESLNRLIKGGEGRTVKIKRNIIASFLIRILTIAINFSIVPLTIEYVSPVKYGVWIIVTSIITWFSFFDFGMANGLRNRLAAALAFNDIERAKKYVSTTYAVFTLLAVGVFILFALINPYINWGRFLNVPSAMDEDIHLIMLVVLGTFCVQFIAQLLSTVLIAMQEPAKGEMITLFGQAAVLVALLILKNTIPGTLLVLVAALTLTPLAFIIASFFFYGRKLKAVAPSFKSIDFSYTKSILTVGGVFFFIQIGALILVQTDNIIITNILGPEAVTEFNVTYKLYSVIYMAFSIIINPYWSAFTDAYAKKDFHWIEGSINKLRKLWFIMAFIIIPVFFVMTKFIFRIWLPDSLNVAPSLSISMAVYMICYSCLALNCYFLNGIGKLKVQLLLYVVVSIVNIPMGIVFGKLWGVEGVILANVMAFIVMNIVLWIQTNRILANKATGIWNS